MDNLNGLIDADEKLQMQGSGLKFLYEMELIDDPQLINNMKMNIMMLSKHIKEVEFLSVYENKQMLILLELSWLGRVFFKKHICDAAHDIVQQLLPNFKFRVINDKTIMEASRKKLAEVLRKGTYEIPSDNTTNAATTNSSETILPEGSNPVSGSKKQPKD